MNLTKFFLNLYLAFTNVLVLPVSLASVEGKFSFVKHSKVFDQSSMSAQMLRRVYIGHPG